MEEINSFARWCVDNYLYLDVLKMKEIYIDLRQNRSDIPVGIKGEVADTVSTHRVAAGKQASQLCALSPCNPEYQTR